MTNSLKLIAIGLYLILNSINAFSGNYKVYKAEKAPVIDGIGNEYCWSIAKWASINQPYDGLSLPAAADFSGRYKLVWTATRLYILMEITDDVLRDDRANPKSNYWDDDCTEFFIDEDHKSEGHECGATAYNAFAYHIAAVARDKNNYTNGAILPYDSPDAINHVIDLGTDCNTNNAMNFDDHVNVKISKAGNLYTWEMEFKIFNKSYNQNSTSNAPVTLTANKVIGFAVAYCDNDNGQRDNMIGDIPNHNDYSGPYPFYRYTNEYGTLTLSDSTLTDPGAVSVPERNAFSHTILISPNPVSNIVNVWLEQENIKKGLAEIVSMSGQTLFSQKITNNNFTIDVKDLPSGMYILQTKVSGELRKQKFIKK
jgi:hypothetical protein